MKGDIRIFSFLGLLLTGLIIFQMKGFLQDPVKTVSHIQDVEMIRMVAVDLTCNVFFIEREQQGVVFEGPEKLVEGVSFENGCIRVRARTGFRLGNVFERKQTPLNVYIAMEDISHLRLTADHRYRLRYRSPELMGFTLEKGDSLMLGTDGRLSCI